jgi:hypothetical protein
MDNHQCWIDWVGLDIEIQHEFDLRTAGMLSSDELRAIEDESWRAAEIAEELVTRQSARDLIPSMIQHHVFNQKVIKIVRDQATKIIDQIDLLIDEFDE